MKRWFQCPDGERIEIPKCLNNCRMGDRCAPLAYLNMTAEEREWTGKASTTQLINGTRLAYLQIVKDYAVTPDDSAFMIVGTRGHGKLEKFESDTSFVEEKLEVNDITGITDLIEEENGELILTDYKVPGSYKVAKALGLKEVTEEVLDENGNIIRYKSGQKKGQIKTRKVWINQPDPLDKWEWDYQLNFYRIGAELILSEPIAKMRIFCIVRDGGTYIAKNRGIERNTYLIDVPRIEDGIILEYFERKKIALLSALDKKELPPMCSDLENWDGRRCNGYCPVAEYCVGNPHIQEAQVA